MELRERLFLGRKGESPSRVQEYTEVAAEHHRDKLLTGCCFRTTMILSPQGALFLLEQFALAFLWGALSYYALIATQGKAQSSFAMVTLCLVALPTAFAFCGAFFLAMRATGALALFCVVPALLESRVNRINSDWKWCFLRMFAATYQGIALGLTVAFIEASPPACKPIFVGSRPDWELLRLVLGIVLGGGCGLTPAAISTVRWMLHVSETRPGLERHLDSEDAPH